MKSLIRTIYLYIPFKKFFFIFEKNFNIRESIFKYLFRGFFLTEFQKKNSTFILYLQLLKMKFLEWTWKNLGTSCLNIWSKIVKKKNTIFDIGANTGIYSLFLVHLIQIQKLMHLNLTIISLKVIYKSKIKNKFNIKIEM